jgi:hypothetical protein
MQFSKIVDTCVAAVRRSKQFLSDLYDTLEQIDRMSLQALSMLFGRWY